MKIVRLNGNDIKKLVQKILEEEENEWFEDVPFYDLRGIYYSRPKVIVDEERGRLLAGELIRVYSVEGNKLDVSVITISATVGIGGNDMLNKIIIQELNRHLTDKSLMKHKHPHTQMDGDSILRRIDSGDLVKFDGGLIEESNVIIKEDIEWFEDIPEYELEGLYYSQPTKKMSGVGSGSLVDVISVRGDNVDVIVTPLVPGMNPETFDIVYKISPTLLKHQIQHYLFHKTTQGLLKSLTKKENHYVWKVSDLIEDIQSGDLIKYDMNLIKESRLFGEPKKTPDERIAEHLFDKIQKERPDIQHQFIDSEKNVTEFYGITTTRGVLEADYFRVDFSNKSTRISKNADGIMQGGDFGILKVYNPIYKNDLGKRNNVIGYAIKMTGEGENLDIPRSLVKKIYALVEEQYGDIKVFKAQRKIDTGTDDASDLFDQLG